MRKAENPPVLLLVGEAAQLLKISKFTVYRLIQNKEKPLPHIRVNDAIRIPRQRLLKWAGLHLEDL